MNKIIIDTFMTISLDFQEISVVLNRFFVKQLTKNEQTVYEYTCRFKENPERGQEQKAISTICYKVGVLAVRLGSKIITKQEITEDRLQGDNWELKLISPAKILNCQNLYERKVLEQLERKNLEIKLEKRWNRTSLEYVQGSLIWWVNGNDGIEKSGEGWEIHRGRKIDVSLDAEAKLYLEIDLHHRLYSPWILHKWLEKYPASFPQYVRNRFKKNNKYVTWKLEDISSQMPDEVYIKGLDITVSEYHRKEGASEQDIQNSYVVFVKNSAFKKSDSVPHLSHLLSPCLTMEMLASVAEQANHKEKQEIEEVFQFIRKPLNERIKECTKIANRILDEIYKVPPTQALQTKARMLPSGRLFGKIGEVDKAAGVRYKGCVKVGELNFGCLNLHNEKHEYPTEIKKCLKEVASKSGVNISGKSYKTRSDLPNDDLERQIFWQEWSNSGIKTILVVTPQLSKKEKQQIRNEALQAGIATQFMFPLPEADPFKAINVVLGLLCKAGWQTVRLEPIDHYQSADLIIGFDTGTNRNLYYGTSAFAILSDGQSLGWELPDMQTGEKFSGEAVWGTVSKLVIKFYKLCGHYPKRILLMRDGLVQDEEFQITIEKLQEKSIAVDVLSVRKSGAGRIGVEIDLENEKVYRDAPIGSVVFEPQENSFLLISSQAIVTKQKEPIGSARPLRVIHEYGDSDLNLLALQTYHLTQLHPASGFRSSRLPWVLQLADKSSKEFQRIGQMSILQNISREKLIAV